MVEGRTGLNIKDFPFAFSIAVLLVPNIMNDSTGFQIGGILLIGGMLGSLLTIINPIHLGIRYWYEKSYSNYIFRVLFTNIFLPKNNFIDKIVSKNFKSALSSPSISFETDKIIGMIYFLFILLLTIIRSFMSDFTQIFNHDYNLILGLRFGATIGFIGVLMILLNHIYGINFRFQNFKIGPHISWKTWKITGLSHFDRICCVTIANLAIDFANLFNAGYRWFSTVRNSEINNYVISELISYNNKIERISPYMTDSYAGFKETYPLTKIKTMFLTSRQLWNETTTPNELYHNYQMIKEISLRYNSKFSDVLTWFHNGIFFKIQELYELEPQLRNPINSRDWYNAELIKYRITSKIEELLINKKMTEF